MVAVLVLALAARILMAQVDGDRGIAAIAASSDIEVFGIEVDTTGKSAEDARENGWREAQRKAWEKIKGPKLSDGQLDSLVSSIVIESESIGPRRYIAKLGVVFDRSRAGRYLGGASAASRSAPMLLVPVTVSAGTETVYEMRNPWQRAWAEYQAGSSRIDYVRPSGAGGDSLMVTYGQTSRRSRTWWRTVLDQFGAADVLVAIARLEYQWPGGPVEGTFTARYGPDDKYLDGFKLTAKNPADLDRMLGEAVLRFNRIYEAALADGKLRPDPTLNLGTPEADPALQRLIELGRAIQRQDAEAARAAQQVDTAEPGAAPTPSATPTAAPATVSNYVVQFASPDGGSVDATLAAVRAASGVRGAVTTSIAIGGTSVMNVSFGGSLEQLAEALRARGFTVRQGGNALAISR